jgi:hypothetical protein
MRKILVLVMFVVASIFLVACNDLPTITLDETPTPTPVEETPTPTPVEETPTPTPVVDTEAPIFSGISTIDVFIGSVFDPKAGVTANDNIDGDLTSAITVTGTVDVNVAGTYILTYRVEDAAGNFTQRERIVNVSALANFVNGDFSQGLTGWATWFNESQDVLAEYSTEGNSAIIDVKEQSILKDNNWWDVQLSQRTLNLKQFESYTLIFTVRAEANRKMMVQVQGGGLPQKPIGEYLVSVTTEDVTYELDFFAKGEGVGVELQFALGTFHKVLDVPLEEQVVLGKVYITNVQIVPGPELQNQAPTLSGVTNVLLPVGANEFVIKSGITVSDDRDVLNIEQVTFEDVSAVPFSFPAVKGTYEFLFTATDSEGLSTTATRFVYVADPFEIANGNFQDVDPITGIPVGWESWFEPTNGGLAINVVEGVVEIDILKANSTEMGGFIWQNQFKIMNLAAFKGSYGLKFDVKADVARKFVVAMEGDGGIGLENEQRVVNATTGWTTISWEFVISQDATQMNRNIQFWFGTLSAIEGLSAADDILTKVYIRNVSVLSYNEEPIDLALGINANLLFDLPIVQGFWNSQTWATISPDTDALYNRFISIDYKFSRAELPYGTKIVISEGYQFRANFWVEKDTFVNTNRRASNLTNQTLVIDETWWGADNFVSFTISVVGTPLINERKMEVSSKFNIYLQYEELDMTFVSGYYDSKNAHTLYSGTSLANNFIANQTRLSKADVPVGSIIMIKEGYQYRVNQWAQLEGTGLSTNFRSANLTTPMVVVTEAWWANGQNFVAFNLSQLGTPNISAKVEEVAQMFTIYVPKALPAAD